MTVERTAEQAFEDVLAGRSTDGTADLAAFTAAVRASAARAPQPNAALTALLSTGLLADQPSPSPATARPTAAPARPTRRRTTVITDLLASCAAKIGAAGLTTKVLAGAGIALAGVTTVAATGVVAAAGEGTPTSLTDTSTLTPSETPEPSETRKRSEPPTPSDIPTTTESPTSSRTGTAREAAEVEHTRGEAPPSDVAVPTAGGLGGLVSSYAPGGGMSGGVASTWAHERNESRRSAGATEDSAEDTSSTGTTDDEDGSEASEQESGTRGGGHGRGGNG